MHKRESVQLASITIFIFGMIQFGLYSFEIGCITTGISFYIMLMSESILLARVQNEMTISLEALRKKQDIEVQDLLFYLRQSKLGNSPWSSVDAAKNHIVKLGLPAIITDGSGACLAFNTAMAETLGLNKDFIGKLCHGLHNADTYGEYIQGIALNVDEGRRYMHSRIELLAQSGDRHVGTIIIIMLPDMKNAVGIWLPDNAGILS
jgi:hypothetical protein